MLFIPVTLAAVVFQVARNAMQRSLLPAAGPWGATLVRFLFGLPFALVFAIAAAVAAGHVSLHLTGRFWLYAASGSVTQVVATAALLEAMRRAGFAIGTAMQQSSLPLSALIGWAVFRDHLAAVTWAGVGVTTVGLAVLSWPRQVDGKRPLSGAGFGLASGLCFGFSLNAYRHAVLALDAAHPLFAAVATVTITQAMQSLALIVYLAWRHPWSLRAVVTGWRRSLTAGFCGAVASGAWLFALALAPAASVRAVGIVEAPAAAAVGRRLFKERLTAVQWLAALTTAVGVAMTALA